MAHKKKKNQNRTEKKQQASWKLIILRPYAFKNATPDYFIDFYI